MNRDESVSETLGLNLAYEWGLVGDRGNFSFEIERVAKRIGLVEISYLWSFGGFWRQESE